MKVVEELGYTPHLVARRLSIGKTLAIAVIAPFFTRPAVSERLNGAVSLLSQSPYDLVIHNIETPEQRNAGLRHILRPERVDGALIISLPILDREIPQFMDIDLPIVLIDTSHPALTQFHRLTVDDAAGGETATNYLLELGHTRIGFIGDRIDNPFHFTSSRDRYFGYCKALQEAGFRPRPEYYGEGGHERDAARKLAQEMLSQSERPTAIFAASDTQAVGVLEAAEDEELNVPQDLSVMGYDDIEIAEILNLTTMRQSLFESGRRGVELLLEMLENPDIDPVHET